MASKATITGQKFGSDVKDFTTNSGNVLADVLIAWCNEGVVLMRKKIRQKARTGQAAHLATRIHTSEASVTPEKVSVKTISDANYWAYVDKGVKGVRNKGKAPQSPFRFRNLFTPPKMIESFKEYIAATGMKTFKTAKGKRRALYKKNKEGGKTFRYDRQEEAAKGMAVATKIGGIKPMNYVREANNPKRNKQLTKSIVTAMSRSIKQSLILSITQ